MDLLYLKSKSVYHFHWIESIGTNIINSITITVGGQAISTLYGEWIRIWHEIFSPTNKATFDKMVGNLPEIFSPEYAVGNSGIYPNSTLNPSLSSDPEIFSQSNYFKNPYLKPPSIRGRTIYVPIPFWFCTNSGLALPLLALQYHEVRIVIELKRLSEIYTILETRPNDPQYNQRVPPNLLKDYHGIHNFISTIPSYQFKENENLTASKEGLRGWGMDPHIDVNYIFLDEEERQKFASTSHEYLIEQVQRHEFIGIVGTKTLELNNPVKELVWYAIRDDFPKRNIYDNFTNWPFRTIDVGSSAYIRNTIGEVDNQYDEFNQITQIVDTAYNAYKENRICSKFNFRYFNEHILQQATLFFNGTQRFSTKDTIYFNYVQPYQHNLYSAYSGCYMYSFSLEPTKIQPSGACNMSRLKSIQLEVTTLDVPMDRNNVYQHQFNVYVFSINYNIFRIVSGMGGLSFTS